MISILGAQSRVELLQQGSNSAANTVVSSTWFSSQRFREPVKNLEIEDIGTAYPHATSVGILEAPDLEAHKVEEVYPKECETLEEAWASIRAWVERYNYIHSHSAMASLPPVKYGGEWLGVLPKMGQNRGNLQSDTPLPREGFYLFLTLFLPVRNVSLLWYEVAFGTLLRSELEGEEESDLWKLG